MSKTRVKEKVAPAPLLDAVGGHQAQPVAVRSTKKPRQVIKIAEPVASREVATRRNDATSTLAVIAEALKDPNFKPENMRLVLDMHKEMIAEQARLDFIHAFFAMKRELPRINRDGKIEIIAKGADGKRPETGGRVQQLTRFATYENIREVIDPILERHGFTMWDETEPSPDGTRLHVKTHLDHNSGHGRASVFPLPAETSGSKNNVQGWGSSFSYGKRYGAIGLLNIRTKAPEDQDIDGNVPKMKPARGAQPAIEGASAEAVREPAEAVITDEQHDTLVEAIEACGATRKAFCHAWKIEKVADLPAESFAAAMKACADRNKGHPRG